MTNNQTKRRGHKGHSTNTSGDKNSISKIYKDIRRSRLCSTHVKASSGPRAKGVPTSNQWRRGSGSCLRIKYNKLRHLQKSL